MKETEMHQQPAPSLHSCNYNDRPVIAVLAQHVKNDEQRRSFIAASYIKYLESSGARVIPIPTSMSDEDVEDIFHNVNGVLFPGGSTDWETSEGYYKRAIYFYTKAKEAADNSDYFPVWGTCLGFEVMHVIESGNDHSVILSDYENRDVSKNLEFTNVAEQSRLFKDMPLELYQALKQERFAYYNHIKGVDPKTYERKETTLTNFFDVLSINKDSQNRTYISTVEAKHYPIYGTQWHPEKNNFEFCSETQVCHSSIAVQAAQHMSNFFVNETRKSKHKFIDEKRLKNLLIYNYSPVYTGNTDSVMKKFEQCYFFD